MTEITIRPKQAWKLLDIDEIWNFRELLYIFAWRDIKVRYKQTILGILWVIFQPITSAFIFTIFFGKIAKIPSGLLPYPLFVFIGLVFWSYFSNSVSNAANSMIENEGIIKKIYFPKVILPISSLITGMIDFFINFLVLLVLAAVLGFFPDRTIVFKLPLSIIIMGITTVGIGLFLSSINVRYRDVRYILPFFIQTLLFLTPVIYSLNNISKSSRLFMALNPMTGSIELIRTIFSPSGFDPIVLMVSLISAVVICFFGLWQFSRTERFFADIV